MRIQNAILMLVWMPVVQAQIGGFGSSSISGGGVREARIGRGGEGIRPFASVSGSYDTSVGNPKANSNGQFETQPSYGVEAGFGAYGTKAWKRTSIGLNYRGDYVQYTATSAQNGSNQVLSLAVTHQFDKKWSAELDVGAGTTNRVYGALQSYVPFDQNFNSIPTNEVLNNRVNYLQASAHANYMKNPRLGMKFGGSSITTRRSVRGLAELQGYTVDGEIFKILSRSTTVGVGYQFFHYHLLGSFGASDIHSVYARAKYRINRDWSANASIQGYRIESLGATVVPLSPEIASLFGRSTGLEAFYRISKSPGFRVSADYARKQVFVSFSGEQSVAPGNGIFLTSSQTSGNASLSYTAEKIWNFGFNVAYTRYSSLTRTLAPYQAILAGVGVTRKMPWLGASIFARYDARKFEQSSLTTVNQGGYRASFGIGFSPRAVPLSLW